MYLMKAVCDFSSRLSCQKKSNVFMDTSCNMHDSILAEIFAMDFIRGINSRTRERNLSVISKFELSFRHNLPPLDLFARQI